MSSACDEIRDELSAYLDKALDAETQSGIEGHLQQCSECLRELDRLKRVDDAYGKLGPVQVPADLEARIHQAVQADVTATATAKQGSNVSRVRFGLSLAVAAGVLLTTLGYVGLRTAGPPSATFQMAGSEVGAAQGREEAQFIPEDTRRQLESLGYLGGDAEESMASPLAAVAEIATRSSAQLDDLADLEADEVAELFSESAMTAMPAPAMMAAPGGAELIYLEDGSALRFEASEEGGWVPVFSPESERVALAGRSFQMADGLYVEERPAYDRAAMAAARLVASHEEAWSTLLLSEPALSALTSLELPVLFQVREVWYLLVAAD